MVSWIFRMTGLMQVKGSEPSSPRCLSLVPGFPVGNCTSTVLKNQKIDLVGVESSYDICRIGKVKRIEIS